MPKKNFDESEENETNAFYDDDYTDDDNASIFDENESEYIYGLRNDTVMFDDVKIRPVLMKRLKLGESIVNIFSNGAIKEATLDSLTYGFSLSGTPFRTYTLKWDSGDYRTFMIHEMVWRAFNGPPPPGWEVRHKPEYTMFPHKQYSNALHNLMISPVIVSKLT